MYILIDVPRDDDFKTNGDVIDGEVQEVSNE